MIKKTLFILFFVLISFLPSFADNHVTGSVDSTTTITATEIITINKDVDINVSLSAEMDRAAETEVISNQDTSGNFLCKNCDLTPEVISGLPLPPPLETEARIDGSSFTGETGPQGIISINQAPGNMNNQENTVSISAFFQDENSVSKTFLHSQAAVEQNSSGNTVDIRYTTTQNIITGDAFKNAIGIIGVNQSAGNMNNQNNSVIISMGGSVILSDASLGQLSSNNSVTEYATYKYDVISGNAFSGVTGIVSINQSSGNMNNQSNIVVISVNGTRTIFE